MSSAASSATTNRVEFQAQITQWGTTWSMYALVINDQLKLPGICKQGPFGLIL